MAIDTSRKRMDRCCRPQTLTGQEAVTRPVRAASYGGGMRRLENTLPACDRPLLSDQCVKAP